MARVTVSNLEKGYGGRSLFSDLSLDLVPGMRLAVAGPNGGGKSTLLRILAGQDRADEGTVTVSKGAGLGYVAQELTGTDLERRLVSWVLEVLPSWSDFWDEWERAVADHDEARLGRLSARQAELEHRFGYNPDHRARTILQGLGFSEADLTRRLGELSGGWRERAKLARVLLQGADVLLLDEPTNHLDLEAIEWLESYLLEFRGTLAFVAHDRVFLDRVGSHVLFISGGGRTVLHRGTFTSFLDREEEHSERVTREAAKLSARIEHEMGYIRRFRVKARKSAQAQSKLKKVGKLEDELDRVRDQSTAMRRSRSLSFSLPEPSRGDKAAVSAVDLRFAYPGSDPVWPPLSFQIFRGSRIALLAPNGAGKSTLLKLITGELEPTSGHVRVGPATKVGYFSQHRTEVLIPERTVLSEIRRLADSRLTEEELMSTLGLFLLGEPYFDRPVSGLSGGEKSRLVLASLFLARANMLVLDEPTNHLDLESRMGLVEALKAFSGTLLFVAHDRYLLNEVAGEVWGLGSWGIEHFPDFARYDAWRRERLARENGRDHGRERSDGPFPEPERKRLSKEDKRAEAERRNAMHRKLKPLQAEYDKLEKALDKAMAEQSEAESRLADPAVYDKPEEALRWNKGYIQAGEECESLMERLAVLEGRMEAVRAKFAGEGA